jgi:putative oxidoreductase
MPRIHHTNGVGAIGPADIALLPARTSLGATMLYHGLKKLRPEGRKAAGAQFEGMGIRPGHAWSLATGIAEAFAGVAMLAGILTRPAALAVLVTQGVAIAKVHARRGFENTKGGYEFNLALMAIAGGVLAAGPGRFSLRSGIRRLLGGDSLVDRLLHRRRQRRALARLLTVVG